MIALPHPLAASAAARPAHPAIAVAGGPILTWGELADRTAAQAGAFARAGVRAGEVHALLGAPSAEWAVAFWALTWVGAIPAPLPPAAPPAELDRAIAALGPAAIWVDPRHPGADRGAWPPPGAPIPAADWALDDTRLCLLSSGTTGPPHPVPLTAAQLAFSAFGSATRLGSLPGDRWLCPLPLHHIGGLSVLLRTAFYGTTAVLMPRFDAARAADLIDGVELASLVPAQLAALLDARGDRPFSPGLRAILVGGAETPAALRERCAAIGAPIALSWGMSETASQIATRFPGDHHPGPQVGPPLPFARVRTEPGGRLGVEGPIAPGGHYLTRDLGDLRGGQVVITGRADDMILSGGENIDPAEIEAALREHPAVLDAAVVGRPDARWGERPVAFVVLNSEVSPRDLAEHCRARLARFKVPDAFWPTPALPESGLGKRSRAALRQEAQRRHGGEE